MTPAESAALERLIIAAKAHPFALTATPAQVAAIEAEVRKIANGDMTRRQAVQIVEALDTESERTQVRGILKVLISMTDTNLLTNLLLRMCKDALAKPTDAEKPLPENNGPRIISVKDAGGEHISITTEGCDNWPKKSGKKTIQATMVVGTKAKPSGERVDAMTPSHLRGSRKTMENAFGPDGLEHTLDVKTGETVQVWVESLDRKQRTPPFPFVWPWRST